MIEKSVVADQLHLSTPVVRSWLLSRAVPIGHRGQVVPVSGDARKHGAGTDQPMRTGCEHRPYRHG